MPTRRTLELIVIAVIAVQPIMGLVRIWAHKTMATAPAGSVAHGTAEIASIVS